MKWRVYYSDGSTYDGETTEDAMAAPTWGALVVKHEAPSNPTGWALRTATFFCWETSPGFPAERWGAKDDFFGLARYYARQIGPQKVLIGEEVDDVLYQDTRAKAIDDGYLDKE